MSSKDNDIEIFGNNSMSIQSDSNCCRSEPDLESSCSEKKKETTTTIILNHDDENESIVYIKESQNSKEDSSIFKNESSGFSNVKDYDISDIEKDEYIETFKSNYKKSLIVSLSALDSNKVKNETNPIKSQYGNSMSSRSSLIVLDTVSSTYKTVSNFKQCGSVEFRTGINLFNSFEEKGLAYMISTEQIQSEPQDIALFLKQCHFLNKNNIGNILGNISNEFCIKILEQFKLSFDFYQMMPDVALRHFQSYFKMPGEAQKIARIMEVFAARYVECNAGWEYAKTNNLDQEDTILVLSYALLMLNTDLHNSQIKCKMTVEEFITNMSRSEYSKSIEKTTLRDIYKNIQTQQFEVGFDHKHQLKQIENMIATKGMLQIASENRQFIGIYELFEVKRLKTPNRWAKRVIFIFNDLLIVTRSRQKATSYRVVASQNRKLFNPSMYYFIVNHFYMKNISANITSHPELNKLLCIKNNTNQRTLMRLICLAEQQLAKIYKEIISCILETTHTEFIKSNIPKDFFKSITSNLNNQTPLPQSILDFKQLVSTEGKQIIQNMTM